MGRASHYPPELRGRSLAGMFTLVVLFVVCSRPTDVEVITLFLIAVAYGGFGVIFVAQLEHSRVPTNSSTGHRDE